MTKTDKYGREIWFCHKHKNCPLDSMGECPRCEEEDDGI